MPLSTRNVFTVTFLCLLSACGAASTHAALAPTPLPLDSPDAQALERAKRSGLCGSDFVTAADRVGDKMIVACGEGKLFVLDRAFNELRSTMLRMRVNSVMPAGTRDIAVFGTTDGAVLQAQLALLDAATLRPIVQHDMTDSTFLGVYRGRAYIDDWCCFGRADVYRPATIYSVSLKDGSESPHVDLTPDPQAHPGESQPLGQGESNYRIGNYFYVHVQDVTYRYDLNDLRKPPVRMRSSVPWGPGTSP